MKEVRIEELEEVAGGFFPVAGVAAYAAFKSGFVTGVGITLAAYYMQR